MKSNLRIKFKMIVALFITIALLAGCGRESKPPVQEGKNTGYLTITDDAGRSVVLQHKPAKIVVLSPSFLELLYAVDGRAIGRPSSSSNFSSLPKEVQDIPEIGFVYNINVEKVVSLQPDLVIAMQGMHEKFVPIFESNNIPVIVLKYKTYDDIFEKITLFGNIIGTQDKAHMLTTDMSAKLKLITDKLPSKTTKVAILHATGKNVTLELENSIAGNTAKLLSLQNIAAGSRPIDDGADKTPYSLEKLVESDPDIIFVVTMGNAAEIEKTMRKDVESNHAWSNLRAVRSNKVVFLPSDLFLINPGLRVVDAAEYMAKVVYPEVYGNDNK